MIVSPILPLLLAVFGVGLAVTEHPLPSRLSAPKNTVSGSAKAAVAVETPVYTGNDPDILNLVSMLQRNGFTDNDELREALRILRPEKFAKGDAKDPRTKRQAGVVAAAAKDGQLDVEKLRPDGLSLNSSSVGSESSSEQTAELPPPDASYQKEDPKKGGPVKKKGLEKIEAVEQGKPSELSPSKRLKRSRAPPIGTPDPLDGVLNTPKTPYIPQ